MVGGGLMGTTAARAEAPLHLEVSFLDRAHLAQRGVPPVLHYGANDFMLIRVKWASTYTKKDPVSYRVWLINTDGDFGSANTPKITDPAGHTGWCQFAYLSPLDGGGVKGALLRLSCGYRRAGLTGFVLPGFAPLAMAQPLGEVLPCRPGTYPFTVWVERLKAGATLELASQTFTVTVQGSADDFAVAGLSSHQVFQRNRKTTGDMPLTVVAPQAGAAIAISVTSVGKTVAAAQATSTGGAQSVIVHEVPVGGPYEVTVAVAGKKQEFELVYMGDLWIISGQSNAVGVGYDRNLGAKPLPGVEQLAPKYGQLDWKPAADGFFESTVGPWVLAAQEFYRQTHVPVGLMGQAEGSRPMDYFLDPHTGDLPFLRPLIQRYGRGAAAFFWYQGESDAFHPQMVAAYGGKLTKLIHEVRQYVGNPHLTVGVVQIGRYTWYKDDHFAGIREAQRQYVLKHPQTMLFSTLPYPVNSSDRIHLVTQGYVGLAHQIAQAMIAQEQTGQTGTPGPMVDWARFEGPDHRRIAVEFTRGQGLQGGDAVDQWYVTDAAHQGFHQGGFVGIARVLVDAQAGRVVLDLTAPPQGPAAVSYGYRCDVGGTLENAAGYAAPAFVGFPVEK